MIRKLVIAALAAAFAVLPIAASAQIGPGTTLVGTIDQSLNSGNVQPGQPFTISHAHTTNDNITGATIYGHVASVQRAGQGTPGKIRLAFDKVNMRSGAVYRVEGYASNVDVVTKNNTGKELIGAAAGALVGGLLFHGVGALIGAGTGGLFAKNNRQNVTVPAGSQVSVRIVRMRPQAQ
jgi:hypothetical protein